MTTPFMDEQIREDAKKPGGMIRAVGESIARANEGENALPPKGYANAPAPVEQRIPPKAHLVEVRLIDGSWGNRYTVSTEFESALRGLLGAMQNVPSMDQLSTVAKEAYQVKEAHAKAAFDLKQANEQITRLQEGKMESEKRICHLRSDRWILSVAAAAAGLGWLITVIAWAANQYGG